MSSIALLVVAFVYRSYSRQVICRRGTEDVERSCYTYNDPVVQSSFQFNSDKLIYASLRQSRRLCDSSMNTNGATRIHGDKRSWRDCDCADHVRTYLEDQLYITGYRLQGDVIQESEVVVAVVWASVLVTPPAGPVRESRSELGFRPG